LHKAGVIQQLRQLLLAIIIKTTYDQLDIPLRQSFQSRPFSPTRPQHENQTVDNIHGSHVNLGVESNSTFEHSTPENDGNDNPDVNTTGNTGHEQTEDEPCLRWIKQLSNINQTPLDCAVYKFYDTFKDSSRKIYSSPPIIQKYKELLQHSYVGPKLRYFVSCSWSYRQMEKFFNSRKQSESALPKAFKYMTNAFNT